MKKVFFIAALLMCTVTINAQFSLGATFGIPTADADDGYSFALSVDANYMFESDSDIHFGVAASYLTYFGKDVTVGNVTLSFENASFLPLAGVFRYDALKNFH